jgi:pilus assembly protein CpaB
VRNWRVLTAVLAVVLAVLAVVLVLKYTDDQKTKAARPFKQVSILVANRPVPAGTSFTSALESGEIKSESFVNKNLPSNYVPAPKGTTNVQLEADFKALIAAHDISEGEAIVQPGDFVGAGQTQTGGVQGQLTTDNAARKKANQQKNLEALTLSIDSEHAVGGFVTPGDTVNAIVYLPSYDDPTKKQSVKDVTAFMLPHIKVLAVGSNTITPQSTQSTTSGSTPSTVANVNQGLITFEVTPRQAEQLIQASQLGTIWLSLNPPTWQAGDITTPTELVMQANLFDQSLTEVQTVTNAIKAGG